MRAPGGFTHLFMVAGVAELLKGNVRLMLRVSFTVAFVSDEDGESASDTRSIYL